jgi:hypothetical protein
VDRFPDSAALLLRIDMDDLVPDLVRPCRSGVDGAQGTDDVEATTEENDSNGPND